MYIETIVRTSDLRMHSPLFAMSKARGVSYAFPCAVRAHYTKALVTLNEAATQTICELKKIMLN